jgi:hypothetical protein
MELLLVKLDTAPEEIPFSRFLPLFSPNTVKSWLDLIEIALASVSEEYRLQRTFRKLL